MRQDDFKDALTPVFRVGVIEKETLIELLEFDLVKLTVADILTGVVVAAVSDLTWNFAGNGIDARIAYHNGTPGRVEFLMAKKNTRAKGWISRVHMYVCGQELKGWAYYPRRPA